MGKARTNPFVFFTHIVCAGFVLLVTLSASAISQDRDSLMRRCLAIADVNERVDCLETGGTPDFDAATVPKTKPARQQGSNASFDCRAARTSIERAICADVTLSEWDFRMGQLFQQALRLAKDRQSLLENQRLWLSQRDTSCGAVGDTAVWSCLLEMTKSRAIALTKTVSSAVEVAQTAQPVPVPVSPTTTQGREFSLGAPRSNPTPSTSSSSQTGFPTTSTAGSNNFTSIAALVLIVFGAAIALRVLRAFRRKQRLVAKYGEEVAARIIERKVWQGMTEEQLTDFLGQSNRCRPRDNPNEDKRNLEVRPNWQEPV